MKYKFNKYLRTVVAATLILTIVIGQGTMQTVLAGLPCPTSMSTIDCNAIHGPWVDWVPGEALCTDPSASATTTVAPTTPPTGGAASSMPYALPATTGPTGSEQAIDANGQLTTADNNGNRGFVTFHNLAKLGQAYQDYYITMRWTYASWNWQGHSKLIDNKQYDWFSQSPRIVLVTNPRTGKSIYAAALESGPGPSVGTTWRAQHGNSSAVTPPFWQGFIVGTPAGYDGIVSGFPPIARDALGAKTGYRDANGGGAGDQLIYQWAPDQSVTPGPTNQTAKSTGGGFCGNNTSTNTAGVNGWDITGPNAMVTYEQYDPKYANQWFGRTIAECGCGPTSMAMAIATLTGDKSVTPTVVADYYGHNGGLADGCGSNWNWQILTQKWPSIKITNIGTNLPQAEQTVKAGGLVLVSYTGAPFTSLTHTGTPTGHIFLIRAVASDGNILIANPLGHYAGPLYTNQNTTEWDPKYFSPQVNDKGGYLKNMWAITKS